MSGIPIKGADSNNYTTRTETGSDGQETQVIKSAFDWVLYKLLRPLARITFDTSGQLRIGGSVGISSGTVTTVTTVTTMTTGNIGIGDMGKPNSSALLSRQASYLGTRSNLRRV